MKNKYSDGSLRRYIEYFVFRHVFLHEQVFMGKFVPIPLTYLPRTTKQTKMAAWWATMSLFRFGFMRKSLDTVTKSEDIQATQQLNSTKLKEPGDKRKAESTSLRSPKQKAYHMYCKRHSSMTVLITMK